MQWVDEAVILSAHPLGDQSLRAILMTRGHGRHAGLMRGRHARSTCQPGAVVQATWRARLHEHLGAWTLEVTDASAFALMDDRMRLGALTSACALVEALTAERDPAAAVHDDLKALIGLLGGPAWDIAYLRWELALLAHAGAPLDLSRCAATGATENLAYVSPRSGRAVSLDAGRPYADRLLALPGFLVESGQQATSKAVLEGLALSGYFLARVLAQYGRGPVPARERFVTRYARANGLDRSTEC